MLEAAEKLGGTMNAHVNVSLMVGGRTEELRELRWDQVDLIGKPEATPSVLPSVQVRPSDRVGGDTKTRKSRRTLALPKRCVAVLRLQRAAQEEARAKAGSSWAETGLVFTTSVGTASDAANVRCAFRRIAAAGLTAGEWTPRELRHSFVSILSVHGLTVEELADLVGHPGTSVARGGLPASVVPGAAQRRPGHG